MTRASAEGGFTPGPWGVSNAGPVMLGYSQPFAIYQQGMPNIVCGVFGDTKGGSDTAHANARLIAAAPCLYEALVKIIADNSENPHFPYDCMTAAIAATRKATGEQP